MKRTKKQSTRNQVSMAYSVDRLPAGVSRAKFYETMIEAILRENGKLPKGWGVTWKWRNRDGKPLLSDTVSGAVRKSRAGFLGLMVRRLQRDAERQGVTIRPAVPRLATESEMEELEEEEEE